LVIAVAALLAWASIAAVASAAPNKKTFSATAGALVAGHTYAGSDTITVTIRNTSSSAELGSANVTVPAGVVASAVSSNVGTATIVGTVIQLRNLALTPDQSVNAAVSAQVECGNVNAPYIWTTATKQSNDFNGTGNDLTGTSPSSAFLGSCGLTFTKQPAHAEKAPAVITSKIYDQTGDPVTVTVLDGQGVQTVTWWSGTIALTIGDDPTSGASLTGGLSGSPSGGSTTFTPSINLSATGYSLVATATPTAGTPSVGTSGAGFESNSFNIVDDATICDAGLSCFAQAGVGQKTSAKVDASAEGGANGDLVILSINDPAVDEPNCAGYNETSDLVVFDVTNSGGVVSSNRSKITTLTLLEEFVTKSASKYRVCYDDGSGEELLENCDNRTPVPPCVLSKAINQAKDLVIVVSSPAGDPKLNF
jgi:hypothetical protein